MVTVSRPCRDGTADSPRQPDVSKEQSLETPAPTILTSPVHEGKQLLHRAKDRLPHGHCGHCKYEVFRHAKDSGNACEKCLTGAKPRASKRRTAVSAEPLLELRETLPPQLVRKCDEAADFLIDSLVHAEHPLSDWFRDLDMGDFELIIDASRGWRAHAGEEVIVQGEEVTDSAPGLFILESGALRAYKRSVGEAHPGTVVKEYTKKGEIFGELAVFYGAPRAATVVAARDCFLWSIDRHTMVSVKRTCIENRRRLYDELLQNVELLKPLGVEERAQLIDNLVPDHFAEGSVIVQQGEEASEFFLLERGEARAEIDGKVVAHYKRGHCFGELALVYDQPRAATVTATSHCKCLCLDRESFNRLLGPLESLHLHCSTAYVELPPRSAVVMDAPLSGRPHQRPRRCEMSTELRPEPEQRDPEPHDPEPRLQAKTTPPRTSVTSVGRMLEDCARKLTWFTSRTPKSVPTVGTPPEPDYVMSPEDRLCYDSDEEQLLLDVAPIQGVAIATQQASSPTVATCLEESEPPCAL